MIYVNRSVHPIPSILDAATSPQLQKELAEAKRYFGNVEKNRASNPSCDIELEKPLILNSCIDRLEEPLVYVDEGQVFSDSERGKASILILGLNRDNLVETRKRNIQKTTYLITKLEVKKATSRR